MNFKQLRRLRVLPGDIVLVRGRVPVEYVTALREFFGNKVTIAQIPHRNFLQNIPFDILERIYLGAKKSYDAKRFVELGDAVRIDLPVDEARAIVTIANTVDIGLEGLQEAFAHGAKRIDRELVKIDKLQLMLEKASKANHDTTADADR